MPLYQSKPKRRRAEQFRLLQFGLSLPPGVTKVSLDEAIKAGAGTLFPSENGKPLDPGNPFPGATALYHMTADKVLFYVTTIHGQRVFLALDDWVVEEPDGIHYYPVKPAIFEESWEEVKDGDAQTG